MDRIVLTREGDGSVLMEVFGGYFLLATGDNEEPHHSTKLPDMDMAVAVLTGQDENLHLFFRPRR